MSDLFRSALNYIYLTSQNHGGQENDFVGQIIELGPLRLNIRRLIAEGGFAFIFLATDQKNIEYALKRLLAADKEGNEAIIREINFLKQLSGHPNIVCCIQAASMGKDQYNLGRNEYLILTEYCKNGPLVDVLRALSEPLNCEQITKIFYQICRSVLHMHLQKPPVIHFDLKIENLLFDSNWTVKLCDFGSATCITYDPDDSWTAQQRGILEEELARRTTPMYRAPEMLDLYQNFPINEKIDIWALGCILYYLCYLQHPFEDSAKLRIINAKYSLPSNDSRYSVFHDLIFGMLQPDPKCRPDVREICDRLEEIAAAVNINLNESINFPQTTLTNLHNASQNVPRSSPVHAESKGPKDAPGVGQTSGSLLGSLKGQAGSIFKNIKDTSAKVVQTVQTNRLYGIGPLFNQTSTETRTDKPSINVEPNIRPKSDLSTIKTIPQLSNSKPDLSSNEKKSRKHVPPPVPPVDYKDISEPMQEAINQRHRPDRFTNILEQPHRDVIGKTNKITETSTSHVECLVVEADLLQLGLDDTSITAPKCTVQTVEIKSVIGNDDYLLGDPENLAGPGLAENNGLNEDLFDLGADEDGSHLEQKVSTQPDLLQGWETLLMNDNYIGTTNINSQPSQIYSNKLIPPVGQIPVVSMHRNVSAPSLVKQNLHKLSASSSNISNIQSPLIDPFEDLANFPTSNGRASPNQSLFGKNSSSTTFSGLVADKQSINNPNAKNLLGNISGGVRPQPGSFSGISNLNSGSNNSHHSSPMKSAGPSVGSTHTPVFARPNYSRSNFDTSSWTPGTKPKVDQNAFDDLLSGQQFNFAGGPKAPQSLGSMKREIEIKEMDPNSIKIKDWTDGKQRNVRALLCSLHAVLWEGNDKWEECTMAQLLTPAQVKKYYRKACLAVHPDKLAGTPHEELARLIFTELNDAWNEFAKSEQILPT